MGVSNGDEDGGGVNGDGFRGQFPVPAGCRNRDFCRPKLVFDGGGATELFMDGGFIFLGFSCRGEYIGERAMSVGGQGPHTLPRRGQGGPAPRLGVASPLAPFDSPSDSGYVLEK